MFHSKKVEQRLTRITSIHKAAMSRFFWRTNSYRLAGTARWIYPSIHCLTQTTNFSTRSVVMRSLGRRNLIQCFLYLWIYRPLRASSAHIGKHPVTNTQLGCSPICTTGSLCHICGLLGSSSSCRNNHLRNRGGLCLCHHRTWGCPRSS